MDRMTVSVRRRARCDSIRIMHRRSLLLSTLSTSVARAASRTEVAIAGDRFLLNGKPTYPGRAWKGRKIEGLLLNSRMIQGIFDAGPPEVLEEGPEPTRHVLERNSVCQHAVEMDVGVHEARCKYAARPIDHLVVGIPLTKRC